MSGVRRGAGLLSGYPSSQGGKLLPGHAARTARSVPRSSATEKAGQRLPSFAVFCPALGGDHTLPAG